MNEFLLAAEYKVEGDPLDTVRVSPVAVLTLVTESLLVTVIGSRSGLLQPVMTVLVPSAEGL